MKKINRIIKKVYPVAGGLLTLVAVYGGIQPLSFWNLYQPKAPKCLKQYK